MPHRKRLGLDRPTDLLAKLNWEIEQLALPMDDEAVASYRAFNCAVTAWSITDWVWKALSTDTRENLRAESPRSDTSSVECFAAWLRERSRELAICQQLANGSKHFVLDRHNDKSISSYRTASVSFFLSDTGEQRVVPTHGVFVEDDVHTYADLALFTRARDYWSDFFARYGIE